MTFLTRELFMMIENNIDIELLSRLYAQQLSKRGEKELLDQSRLYYRMLKKLVQYGHSAGRDHARRSPPQRSCGCTRSRSGRFCMTGSAVFTGD